MTISRHYTLITPSADRTGPTNVAVEVGRAAVVAGWNVSLLYLSGATDRDDLEGFSEVRRLRPSDLFMRSGVIHTHGLRPDLVGWLFSWNPRCTVMTTLHGHFPHHLAFDYPGWKVHLAWAVWSRALARFDHRVCISVTMRRFYRRYLPKLTFDLAYNFRSDDLSRPAVTPSSFEPWLITQRQAGRIVLAYVGSLSTRKNVQPLLEAVRAAPELSLVVCGNGPLRDQLTAQARSGQFGDRVLLLGHQPQPECIVAASDMLVLASHAEGLPLVVLEAARVGRPSLMSNIAVHRELAGLGLGLVFERHGFSNFREQAHALARRTSDAAIGRLWKERFSDEVGFQQYEFILRGESGLHGT